MTLSEFGLIERYLAPLGQARSDLPLGIGDDCALLLPPAGYQLAVSLDTLVEGVHFLPGMAPDALAHRAFHAALSDLAAMGAEPRWLTLALTMPAVDESWLRPFCRALGEQLDRFGMVLAGGDTTRGPLCLSLQVHGVVPGGQALQRNGAQPDDLICVSGTLGDAMAGLAQLQAGEDVDPWLRQRFERPEARICLGLALRGLATAAIDLSDGLCADLGHLLSRSGVGAEIRQQALPLSPALRRHYTELQARQLALQGGEDFELCFTLPADQQSYLTELSEQLDLPLTVIGSVLAEPGLYQSEAAGSRQPIAMSGYQHF